MKKGTVEIILEGRGGQGVKTAGETLAGFFFRQGYYVQAMPSFTAERRGGPSAVSIRISNKPIHFRYPVKKSHFTVLFTPVSTSLITRGSSSRGKGNGEESPPAFFLKAVERTRPDGVLVVNAGGDERISVRDVPKGVCGDNGKDVEDEGGSSGIKGIRCWYVNGEAIAREHGLGGMPGIPLIGGLFKAAGWTVDPAVWLLDRRKKEDGMDLSCAFTEGYDRAVGPLPLSGGMGKKGGNEGFSEEGDLPLSVPRLYLEAVMSSHGPVKIGCGWSRKRKCLFGVFPMIERERCGMCGMCALYCPEGIIHMEEGGPAVDFEYCKGCGICAEVCPEGAVKLKK